jgi:glycosyltransferase A (GT-A) superfamily protein (DUF2064 family)
VIPVGVLVVAKAPVPGLAKTRLAAALGADVAADIAAAALLDTLDAVADCPAAAKVVALTGNLDDARCADEIRSRLDNFIVIGQRGADLAERLVHAHRDAAAATGGLPIVQIGMDTPQVSPELLERCAQSLLGSDAVLGLAGDGGWWVLGVRDAAFAECLRNVPMSTPDTGAVTLAALQDTDIHVELVCELVDVDTIDDVGAVRAGCGPGSRFSRATAGVGP